MLKFSILILLLLTIKCDYDAILARYAMEMASASYCDENLIKSWTCKHCTAKGITDISTLYITSDELFVFSAYDSIKNRIIIAFRGTDDDNVNWITNFDLP